MAVGIGGLEISQQDFLIFLIHGTYAADATWPRSDSAFRQSLGDELRRCGAGEVVFAESGWTGGNSDLDRVNGSLALRERLASSRTAYPNHATFLLGHSHGGNVALHALSHSVEDRETVAGVITLATPFLLYGQEPVVIARVAAALFDLRFAAFIFGGIGLLALVVYSLVLWLLPAVFEIKIAILHAGMGWRLWLCERVWSEASCRSVFDVTFLTVAVLLGSIFPIGFMAASWSNITENAVNSEADARRSVEHFYYVQPPERLAQMPIMVLWSAIDEALQILNFSWWAHRLALWAARLWIFVMVIAAIAATYGIIWWVYSRYNLAMSQPSPSSAQIVSNSILAAVTFPLVYSICAIVGWLFRALVRLPVPLHGSRTSLDNLLWTLRAKRAPFTGRNVTCRNYSPAKLFCEAPGLIHSTLYGSKAAVPDIAAWIVDTAAARQPKLSRADRSR